MINKEQINASSNEDDILKHSDIILRIYYFKFIHSVMYVLLKEIR